MSHNIENECPIALNELLDSVGLKRGEFADLMNVNRKTVSRWLMVNEVTDEMLSSIDAYKLDMTHAESERVPLPTQDMVIGEIPLDMESDYLPITKVNLAHSVTWHNLDKLQIAQRFELSVFEYNKEIKKLVDYCLKSSDSFAGLRA